MNTKQPDIHKTQESFLEKDNAFFSIICALLETREAKHAFKIFLPEFLKIWADKSLWRKFLSKIVGYNRTKPGSTPTDISEDNELRQLFKDEIFIKNLTKILPGFINQIISRQLPRDQGLGLRWSGSLSFFIMGMYV